MSIIVAALFHNIISAFTLDLLNTTIEKKINAYTKTETENISIDKLIIKGPINFINDNGLRRTDENKGSLRIPAQYHHPSEKQLKIKLLDMMKQSVYATQDRMKSLEPILADYQNEPAFRMAFIYNRLDQLVIDIRRIYTVLFRQRFQKRVYEQVWWYAHCSRKYVDVLYVVQYLIDEHVLNTKEHVYIKVRDAQSHH